MSYYDETIVKQLGKTQAELSRLFDTAQEAAHELARMKAAIQEGQRLAVIAASTLYSEEQRKEASESLVRLMLVTSV
jgi:hypothetical protein